MQTTSIPRPTCQCPWPDERSIASEVRNGAIMPGMLSRRFGLGCDACAPYAARMVRQTLHSARSPRVAHDVL
jgi:hypothetical protein